MAKNDDAVWHNKTEFMVWSYAVLNNDYSVFAPVIALSDCWKYLVMVKVERVGEFRVKQRFMPSYMKGADLHFSNIGLLGGKPVFCDYGDPVILDRFPIPV